MYSNPPLHPHLPAFLIWIILLCRGLAAAPAAPAAFKATAIAHNYIGLSWVDSSMDEVGFEIQVKKNSGSFGWQTNICGCWEKISVKLVVAHFAAPMTRKLGFIVGVR